MTSQGNSTKILRRVNICSLLKQFQKIKEERTLLTSSCEASITLIPKSDKDTIKKTTGQYLWYNRCKNPQQNMSKPNQQYIKKKIIHHDQVVFILGMQMWFNICKSINMINKIKDKNHMIISIDSE